MRNGVVPVGKVNVANPKTSNDLAARCRSAKVHEIGQIPELYAD